MRSIWLALLALSLVALALVGCGDELPLDDDDDDEVLNPMDCGDGPELEEYFLIPCEDVGSGDAFVDSDLAWSADGTARVNFSGQWLEGDLSVDGTDLLLASASGGVDTFSGPLWASLPIVPGPARVWYELWSFGEDGYETRFAVESGPNLRSRVLLSRSAVSGSQEEGLGIPAQVAEAWGVQLELSEACPEVIVAPDSCGTAVVQNAQLYCGDSTPIPVSVGDVVRLNPFYRVVFLHGWDYASTTCEEPSSRTWDFMIYGER